MTAPTTEPARFVAGDTLEWVKTLPSYPATAGWVLGYTLVSASAAHSFAATASSEAHAVSVPASTTAGWAAGSYAWTAYVTLGAARHTVGTGRITIAPDLAAITTGLDMRSAAKKALDALDAYIANPQNLTASQYSINGRELSRHNFSTLMEMRSKLVLEVAKEDRAASLAAGLRPGNLLAVRFTMR